MSGPLLHRGESAAEEVGEVLGIWGLISVAHGYCDVVSVGGVDVGSSGAVGGEEIEEGGGEYRSLWDAASDDSAFGDAGLVQTGGGTAPEVGC